MPALRQQALPILRQRPKHLFGNLVDSVFAGRLSDAERRELLSLVYYVRETWTFLGVGHRAEAERTTFLESRLSWMLELVRVLAAGHTARALERVFPTPFEELFRELAREVALSRSALAERFTELVGEPPMQYLMRWRLALAAQMLRSGQEAVIRVAERSGYESEAAFSRAFKREFGMPPAAWRRAAAR